MDPAGYINMFYQCLLVYLFMNLSKFRELQHQLYREVFITGTFCTFLRAAISRTLSNREGEVRLHFTHRKPSSTGGNGIITPIVSATVPKGL